MTFAVEVEVSVTLRGDNGDILSMRAGTDVTVMPTDLEQVERDVSDLIVIGAGTTGQRLAAAFRPTLNMPRILEGSN